MKYLLVLDGKVVQVEDKTFQVHKSLIWIKADGKVGDSYIDGKVVPYVKPVHVKTIRQQRREAYEEAFTIGDQIDIIHNQLVTMKDQITITPETQEWMDTISAIKLANPKIER